MLIIIYMLLSHSWKFGPFSAVLQPYIYTTFVVYSKIESCSPNQKKSLSNFSIITGERSVSRFNFSCDSSYYSAKFARRSGGSKGVWIFGEDFAGWRRIEASEFLHFFHTRVEVKIVVWCRIFLDLWNQRQIAHIYTFLICSLFPLEIEKILFCLKFAQIKSIWEQHLSQDGQVFL